VLAAASLAVQAHADVVFPIGQGQARPLSLFLITVAESGERKTATDRLALRRIAEREETLAIEYRSNRQKYNCDLAAYQAVKAKALKKATGDAAGFAATRIAINDLGPEPVAPLSPMLVCSEPTYEGLVLAFLAAQPSMGLFYDEGALFVGANGMNAENGSKMIPGLSSFWDGTPVKRVRAGDGATVISGRRLAAHLMMQPNVASNILSDAELRDQGFLPRVLVAAPCSTAGSRFQRDTEPRIKLI
jgi:hypothetical protein